MHCPPRQYFFCFILEINLALRRSLNVVCNISWALCTCCGVCSCICKAARTLWTIGHMAGPLVIGRHASVTSYRLPDRFKDVRPSWGHEVPALPRCAICRLYHLFCFACSPLGFAYGIFAPFEVKKCSAVLFDSESPSSAGSWKYHVIVYGISVRTFGRGRASSPQILLQCYYNFVFAVLFQALKEKF